MIPRIAGLSALACVALASPSWGRAPAPPATCGPAALADGTQVTWDAASGVSGDFDMDGEADVAYLGRDAEKTLVMIAACRGTEVRRRWLFAVPAAAVSAGAPRLEAASLLLDEGALARTCASPTSRSECDHLRRANLERQTRMDAGARALRVASPGGPGMLLTWAPDLGGFVEGRG